LASGARAVHAEAPFGGWKAAGFGPPEHGVWDREFYTRPQAVYGGRHAETES
jgi:aldehyde dehydrogenase (NAD+)